jgi:hypothetical protein
MTGSASEIPMKRIIAFFVTLCVVAVVHPQFKQETDPLTKKERFALELQACQDAYANGKPSKCELYGKIKVVDNFPDVKVKKVDNFADIKVKWVDNFADEPGKWKKVDNFPDYKVQFVDNFPDYKIEEVDNFPGCE